MSFKFQECDTWRRITPDGTASTVMYEVRPHLVPTTEEAEKFVAIDAFGCIGHSGLCPGEVLIDGEWKHAYRFVKLTEKDAVSLISQLEAEIDNLSE